MQWCDDILKQLRVVWCTVNKMKIVWITEKWNIGRLKYDNSKNWWLENDNVIILYKRVEEIDEHNERLITMSTLIISKVKHKTILRSWRWNLLNIRQCHLT